MVQRSNICGGAGAVPGLATPGNWDPLAAGPGWLQKATKEDRGRVWRELPAASRGSGSGVSPEQVDVAESRPWWSESMSEAMSS